jgi:hypothetical protein
VSKLEYTIPYTCAFSVVTALPRNAFMIGASIVNKDVSIRYITRKKESCCSIMKTGEGRLMGKYLGRSIIVYA